MRAAQQIENINPRGRVDVLAFRVLERLAGSQCPVEWPLLEGLAWDVCRGLRPKKKRRRRRIRR